VQAAIQVPENYHLTDKISPRFLAIKLLENDGGACERIESSPNRDEILRIVSNEVKAIESALGEESETLITDTKYGFIAGALRQTYIPNSIQRIRKTDIIDTFITHKLWGIPVFLFFMWFTFFVTFRLGAYPMGWIEQGVDALSATLYQHMQGGWLKDLFIQGILGGVGGVIVFLPNILLLYFFISLMEDTGYMARAVFIMDKAMHKIGLHGKSFIPLLMGFGCNVPAILSTRIIESRRDRMITMLINPFMSCSARLPVYILFISAFFVNYQATILFSIYATGILIAILSALLFSRTFFRKVDVPFVMELPPYRIPSSRTLIKHMWFRTEQYLRKIGGIILAASIIIWALGYFPRYSEGSLSYQNQLSTLSNQANEALRSGDIERFEQLGQEVQHTQVMMQYEQQKNSYIGQIGRFIQPMLAPLGFDWKMSVAILSGVAAKEIVVGTLGVLYQTEPENREATSVSLIRKLQDQTYLEGEKKGQKVFDPVVAMAFMIFVLIYFPCVAVIAAISRESGSWKWALFTVVYTSVIAWVVAFLVFQTGSLIS